MVFKSNTVIKGFYLNFNHFLFLLKKKTAGFSPQMNFLYFWRLDHTKKTNSHMIYKQKEYIGIMGEIGNITP